MPAQENVLPNNALCCCCVLRQVECEHQLTLERDKTAAAAAARDAAVSRAQTAEARAADSEV